MNPPVRSIRLRPRTRGGKVPPTDRWSSGDPVGRRYRRDAGRWTGCDRTTRLARAPRPWTPTRRAAAPSVSDFPRRNGDPTVDRHRRDRHHHGRGEARRDPVSATVVSGACPCRRAPFVRRRGTPERTNDDVKRLLDERGEHRFDAGRRRPGVHARAPEERRPAPRRRRALVAPPRARHGGLGPPPAGPVVPVTRRSATSTRGHRPATGSPDRARTPAGPSETPGARDARDGR